MGRRVGFQSSVWDTGTALKSGGLGDGKDSGIPVLCGKLLWSPRDLGMGRKVGFQCCVWDTGNPRDSSEVPATGGWEGQ